MPTLIDFKWFEIVQRLAGDIQVAIREPALLSDYVTALRGCDDWANSAYHKRFFTAVLRGAYYTEGDNIEVTVNYLRGQRALDPCREIAVKLAVEATQIEAKIFRHYMTHIVGGFFVLKTLGIVEPALYEAVLGIQPYTVKEADIYYTYLTRLDEALKNFKL